jgi:hypothetical protein
MSRIFFINSRVTFIIYRKNFKKSLEILKVILYNEYIR